MYVLLDFFLWKGPQLGPLRPMGPRSRAPAGVLEVPEAQIQDPSWGPRGPWGPDSGPHLGPKRPLVPRFHGVVPKFKKKKLFFFL